MGFAGVLGHPPAFSVRHIQAKKHEWCGQRTGANGHERTPVGEKWACVMSLPSV
jgi:hypothetical protein